MKSWHDCGKVLVLEMVSGMKGLCIVENGDDDDDDDGCQPAFGNHARPWLAEVSHDLY